ncbi:MAG: YceI family protein [Planctomycetota bacterium]
MKLMTTLVALTFLTSIAQAADVQYPLTGDNTKVEWVGSKADGTHAGGFKKVTGAAVVKGDKGLSLELEIDCASLYSDSDKLTGHLKSPDFFAVKDHPTATFVSKSVKKHKSGYEIVGDLTLLGKTKEIHFPATIASGDKLALKADFKIIRSEFGMTYGKGKVNDDVAIKVTIGAKPEGK